MRVVLLLTLFIGLSFLPAHQVTAQTAGCISSGTPRAEGLVSSTSLSGNFGTTSGACIIEPKAAFLPFKIPTYNDLKSVYFTQRNPPPSVQKSTITTNATQTSLNFTQDSLILVKGNLNLSGNPAGSRTGVVFVDGTLNITSNITYGSGDSGLVLAAGGNINISPSVTQINAVLISSGTICTAWEGSCPNVIINPPTPTSGRLVVNGNLISLNPATPIIFRRNLVNNQIAAEEINDQPKYLVILKDLFSDSLKEKTELTNFNSTDLSSYSDSSSQTVCADSCGTSDLHTGMVRDQNGNCSNSGTHHLCPSSTYNGTNIVCNNQIYTCNSTWRLPTASPTPSPSVTPSPTPSPSPTAAPATCPGTCTNSAGFGPGFQCTVIVSGPTVCPNAPYTYCSTSCTELVCNATPVCSNTCTAPANSCSTNNGTKTCNYTTYTSGNFSTATCRQASAPNQPCTQDTCSASGNTCVSGVCKPPPVTYEFDKEYGGTQGPIWYYKYRASSTFANMLWGQNPFRSAWNACCHWYAPNGYSMITPDDTVANFTNDEIFVFWKAPRAGSAQATVTAKGWAWNGTSCGDGFDIGLRQTASVDTYNGTDIQTISVNARDTSLKTMTTTRTVQAGQALMFRMYSKGDPCNDDIDLNFVVTLTPS